MEAEDTYNLYPTYVIYRTSMFRFKLIYGQKEYNNRNSQFCHIRDLTHMIADKQRYSLASIISYVTHCAYQRCHGRIHGDFEILVMS